MRMKQPPMKKPNPFRVARYVLSAHHLRQLPADQGIEVAIAGRSNAGKSSAINTFTDQKSLARTSKTPGRTQQIVIFEIDEARRIADLPGYGYAKVPAGVRRQWGPMIETYLTQRRCLRGLILIVDIRRTPGQEEETLLHWLDHHGIACRIVATKADKLSRNKQIRPARQIAAKLALGEDELLLFSAKSGLGLTAVWDHIEEMLGSSS